MQTVENPRKSPEIPGFDGHTERKVSVKSGRRRDLPMERLVNPYDIPKNQVF
ncbi:MAG: hypothetical protein ACYDCO_08950 [Armatimonadota bacterium]